MTEKHVRKVLLTAGSLLMAAFCLAPILFMFVTSLARDPQYLAPDRNWSLSLEHYAQVLNNPAFPFRNYLVNSLGVSLLTMVMVTGIAAMAAYAVTHIRFRGRGILVLAVLTVSMFPQIAMAGYLFRMVSGLGLFNTWWALVLPYTAWTLPLAFWILLGVFSQLPQELDEAARMDGCGRMAALVRVLIPPALPGLLSAALLVFIFSMNEFMFALLLTCDSRARTLPVGIALMEGLHGQIPWGSIMAASMLAVMPLILLSFIFQRQMIRGLTAGTVKG